MGILDRVVVIEGEGAVLGVNVGCPIVASGDGDTLFVVVVVGVAVVVVVVTAAAAAVVVQEN